MSHYPPDTIFVVAAPARTPRRAAARKAGRPVKLTIGGVTGWLDEGLEPHIDRASQQ